MSDHVPGTMHRDQHGNVIEDYHMCGCQLHMCRCRLAERSAGAAPIDVERLAEAIRFDSPTLSLRASQLYAEAIAAEYARLAEETDR